VDETNLARFQVLIERMPQIAVAIDCFTDAGMRQQAYYTLLHVLDPEPDDQTVAAERERDELAGQIQRLAAFIGDHVPVGEPAQGQRESAVDTAIWLLGRLIDRTSRVEPEKAT
jgi:hypothetical protein